jgi:hypothetical protein
LCIKNFLENKCHEKLIFHQSLIVSEIAGDSGIPNGWMAIRKMTEMRENQSVVAFIGPDNSCASEGLVAAAWNTPILSFV